MTHHDRPHVVPNVHPIPPQRGRPVRVVVEGPYRTHRRLLCPPHGGRGDSRAGGVTGGVQGGRVRYRKEERAEMCPGAARGVSHVGGGASGVAGWRPPRAFLLYCYGTYKLPKSFKKIEIGLSPIGFASGSFSQLGLFTPECGVRLHVKLNAFPSTYTLETCGSLFKTRMTCVPRSPLPLARVCARAVASNPTVLCFGI